MSVEALKKHSQNIMNNFNKAAETYDANCCVQKEIGKKLISILKQYKPNARNIIDLGCGTGLITKELATCYHGYQQFYALDIADKLLEKACKTLSQFEVTILKTNFENFRLSTIYFDLIYSNMAIHWSSSLEVTLRNIYDNLSIEGVFAFSIPVSGTFSELKFNYILPLYSFKAVKHSLTKCGFRVLYANNYDEIIEFPSFIAALKSIKLVGANYSGSRIIDLTKLLSHRKSTNKNFTLTYKIGMFVVCQL